MNPGTTGQMGQVIFVAHDSDERLWVSESLAELVDECWQQLESGRWKYSDEDGFYMPVEDHI